MDQQPFGIFGIDQFPVGQMVNLQFGGACIWPSPGGEPFSGQEGLPVVRQFKHPGIASHAVGKQVGGPSRIGAVPEFFGQRFKWFRVERNLYFPHRKDGVNAVRPVDDGSCAIWIDQIEIDLLPFLGVIHLDSRNRLPWVGEDSERQPGNKIRVDAEIIAIFPQPPDCFSIDQRREDLLLFFGQGGVLFRLPQQRIPQGFLCPQRDDVAGLRPILCQDGDRVGLGKGDAVFVSVDGEGCIFRQVGECIGLLPVVGVDQGGSLFIRRNRDRDTGKVCQKQRS